MGYYFGMFSISHWGMFDLQAGWSSECWRELLLTKTGVVFFDQHDDQMPGIPRGRLES